MAAVVGRTLWHSRPRLWDVCFVAQPPPAVERVVRARAWPSIAGQGGVGGAQGEEGAIIAGLQGWGAKSLKNLMFVWGVNETLDRGAGAITRPGPVEARSHGAL